jgi:hypothetical protein
VNAIPLLFTAFTVTTTLPDVAALGTGTVMLVALQFVGVAATPLKATVLLPCKVWKPVPVIVTSAPMAAEFGESPVMEGPCEPTVIVMKVAGEL